MEWCAMNGVPFCIIYTKADKMSGLALQQNLKGIETEMLKEWDRLCPPPLSAVQKQVSARRYFEFL